MQSVHAILMHRNIITKRPQLTIKGSGIMSGNRVCHFKLVLLGDTAVGKSCLVVRFVRDEFFEFQEPTIGGEFLAKTFQSVFIAGLVLLSPASFC